MKLSLCSYTVTLYIILNRVAARIGCILAIIWLLLVAPAAFADKVNAYTQHQYPLQFEREGRLTGFSVEVVNRLFELAGDNGTISVMPWAKAYNTVLREPNTMLFSVARNKIAKKQFHWVGVLVKSNRTLF